jgi:hypothetical protein
MHNGTMRVAWVACLLVGCNYDHGVPGGVVIDGGDPPIDMRVDGPPGDGACTSYSSLFDTCTTMMGTMGITLTPGTWDYNTDTHVFSGSADITAMSTTIAGVDMVFVSSFTVQAGAILRVTHGTANRRGIGIASTGSVQIDGIIDLSAGGAGSRSDIQCGGLRGQPGEDRNGGAGGGGGAAFQAAGGGGSQGDADSGSQSNGGSGGTAITMRPSIPIGGCSGGRGGGTSQTNGGDGGAGGGALYIASGTSITLGTAGILDAGGQGGYEGGNNADAGGGGGAGGMIVIESKVVTVSGVIVANGGGGGEGNTNGNRGENGRRNATRAQGGSGGDGNGGDGGDGGAASALGGATTNDLRNGGGGGGGGAAGYIAIGSATLSLSPVAISPPHGSWP